MTFSSNQFRYRKAKTIKALLAQKEYVEALKIHSYDPEVFRKLTDAKSILPIGRDLDGRALILVRPSLMFVDSFDQDDSVRWFYHSFKTAI